MALINGILETSSALVALLAASAVAADPVSILYCIQAGTYGSAAVAAGAGDHRVLCRCYVVSAALHGLIGICHGLHI